MSKFLVTGTLWNMTSYSLKDWSSEMLCRERFIDVQTDAMMRMVFKLTLRVKGRVLLVNVEFSIKQYMQPPRLLKFVNRYWSRQIFLVLKLLGPRHCIIPSTSDYKMHFILNSCRKKRRYTTTGIHPMAFPISGSPNRRPCALELLFSSRRNAATTLS